MSSGARPLGRAVPTREEFVVSQLPDEPQVSAATSATPPTTAAAGGFSAPEAPGSGLSHAAHGELASRWLRLAGAIIDGVILTAIAWAIGVIAGATDQVGIYVIYLVISLLYGPVLLARDGEHNGQTIGKQAVGIRVTRESGEPMTFGTGALREVVGKSIPSAVTFGLYGLIDSLWCLWDKKKQCLHDKIASTVVTRA
jgi:uncharacterized RDD family membrane protein YckC